MNSTDDNGYWVQLHSQLQDKLAGYLDGELDAKQQMVIEAHLAGCNACRADVKRQQILQQRLRGFSQASFPESQDTMFDDMVDKALQARPHYVPGLFAAVRSVGQRIARVREPLLLGSGWAVALLITVVMFMADYSGEPGKTTIPMVNDVVAEYRNIELDNHRQINLSGSHSLPVGWPGIRVLATWKTQVGGAPAQAYAVRSGRYLLFQYRVDERVFYRNSQVRDAVAREGQFDLRTDELDVMALPVETSGVLLVGPADSLPAITQLQKPAEI